MSETRTFRLDKLVRDGIILSTEKQGGSVDYSRLQGEDRLNALIGKVAEELSEFDISRDAKELSQVYGVLMALAKEAGLTEEDLKTLEQDRQNEVGGFDLGLFVRSITLPAGNKWAEYYGSQPERYYEVTE